MFASPYLMGIAGYVMIMTIVATFLYFTRLQMVAAAETDYQDLHRRALVTVAAVAGDAAHARGVADACEEWMSGLPEITLVGARRRLFGGDDEGVG